MLTRIQTPSICIVDHTGQPHAALTAAAHALTRQAREHFGPVWNAAASVRVGVPTTGEWLLGLFVTADMPGALGYHDETPTGLPVLKVFPSLDAQDGVRWETTASHEVLEALADPYLRRATQDDRGRFWALEVGDPVEADSYEIDGVPVSNFVTPQWFEPPRDQTGVRFDHLGRLTAPFTMTAGGYMQWYDPKLGWQEVDAKHRAFRREHLGRRARRCGRPAA